jgi:hypothetical protein
VLDSAAAAARRVNTPAARVTVENGRAVVTVKNNARVARLFQPSAARYGVKFNIVAGVYPGAAPAAMAGVFCAHAFNHCVPFKELIIFAK